MITPSSIEFCLSRLALTFPCVSYTLTFVDDPAPSRNCEHSQVRSQLKCSWDIESAGNA